LGCICSSPLGKRQANIFPGIFLVLISLRLLRSLHFHYYGPEFLPYLIGHAAFLLAVPFIWFYYIQKAPGRIEPPAHFNDPGDGHKFVEL